MSTAYQTLVIGSGNHASLEIPDKNLREINANRRAPLKITVNGHTYQSTATGVDGKCMVVFSSRDRQKSGVKAGDLVNVTLELDTGYRHVDIPQELSRALAKHQLKKVFHSLPYFKRREFTRQITEAKALSTKMRRIKKIVDWLAK